MAILAKMTNKDLKRFPNLKYSHSPNVNGRLIGYNSGIYGCNWQLYESEDGYIVTGYRCPNWVYKLESV